MSGQGTYADDVYHKLLPLHASSTVSERNLATDTPSSSNLSIEMETEPNLLPNFSSDLSFSSSTKSTETTKSALIQRILDSLRVTCSNSTVNTSLSSSIHGTILPCQSENVSNKIYITFKTDHELGRRAHVDDLLEAMEKNPKCSCQAMGISFNDQLLDRQLSYKQRRSILRIVLRQQQLCDRYFS